MPTPEEAIFEYTRQRATPRQVVAPDLQIDNGLARVAAASDIENRTNALTNPNYKGNTPNIGIGTNATYNTLPANASRINYSALFTVITPI